MTIGVGDNSNQEKVLAQLTDMTTGIKPIQLGEFKQRVKKAQAIMRNLDIPAIYVNAGTNLYYFTGTKWHPSERLVGAIIPAEGAVEFIAPYFEIDTLKGFMQLKGKVHGWHEDESPYQLLINVLHNMGISKGKIGIDESAAFFIYDGLSQISKDFDYVNAKPVTACCRMQKSANEIALLQRAKAMTLEVHKAAAKILKPGISTQEVTRFIDKAHQKVGACGSSFCIVLFGTDTAFPHGVKTPKNLEKNDIVLIDTGCLLEGYNSDITRTYVFGQPTAKQRKMWSIEKEAQNKAFIQATLNSPCGDVDTAARNYLESQGLGPAYEVPGLPHRTGHGIGLDIHEWPYLVKNDRTPLAPGMCFSNEPMLVIPGEFGIRLEDHFYMTEDGPKWFTEPSHSIDDPFGYDT